MHLLKHLRDVRRLADRTETTHRGLPRLTPNPLTQTLLASAEASVSSLCTSFTRVQTEDALTFKASRLKFWGTSKNNLIKSSPSQWGSGIAKPVKPSFVGEAVSSTSDGWWLCSGPAEALGDISVGQLDLAVGCAGVGEFIPGVGILEVPP